MGEFKKLSHVIYRCDYHIVWTAKYRFKILEGMVKEQLKEDARSILAKYIGYYNRTRLHSALYYLSPEDFLIGREKQRVAQREQKLQKAALQREEYWKKNEAA